MFRLFALLLLTTPAFAQGIFEVKAKLKVEAEKGVAGEGPAWDPRLGILTSGNGNIHRLTREGDAVLFRQGAGTNGLLFDRDGRLIACEPERRRMTRTDAKGQLTVLTDSFGGKKYNTPNDVTVDSQGRIYFSDPCYGPRDGLEQKDDAGKMIKEERIVRFSQCESLCF